MLRNILAIAVVLVVGSASSQIPAGATPVQVNYTITSGTFRGPLPTGPVTSGSASVLLPFAAITASPYSYTKGGPVLLTRLTLAGPNGAFAFTYTAATYWNGAATLTPLWGYATGWINNGGRVFSSNGMGTGAFVSPTQIVWNARGPSTNVNGSVVQFLTSGYWHSWNGTEINRVFIPEPNTAAFVTFGLTLVGGLAAAKRRRSKPRQI